MRIIECASRPRKELQYGHDTAAVEHKCRNIAFRQIKGRAGKGPGASGLEGGHILTARNGSRALCAQPLSISGETYEFRCRFPFKQAEITLSQVLYNMDFLLGKKDAGRLPAPKKRARKDDVAPGQAWSQGICLGLSRSAKRLIGAADIAFFQVARRHTMADEQDSFHNKPPIHAPNSTQSSQSRIKKPEVSPVTPPTVFLPCGGIRKGYGRAPPPTVRAKGQEASALLRKVKKGRTGPPQRNGFLRVR